VMNSTPWDIEEIYTKGSLPVNAEEMR